MLLSDWVNVVLCILSFLLALISVVTVVISLRQNHHMIENATRPYVTIYGAVTGFYGAQVYLVLRNFGQSSALITEFSSSVQLSSPFLVDDGLPIPFEHIVGYTLAPGQAIHAPINHIALKNSGSPLAFHIRYSFCKKEYEENAIINMDSLDDHLIVHAAKGLDSTQEIARVANVLEEIAVQQL